MVAKNRVTISLEAQDNSSAAFKKLQDSLGGTVLKANLAANAITAAMSGIGNVIGKITNGVFSKLNTALETSTSSLITVSDVSKVTGLSLKEAGNYVSELEKTLASAAAALPGTTAGYIELAKGITDNLVPAFKDASGAMDLEGMKEYQKELTKSAGVRVAASGGALSNADASLGLSKALSGNVSLKELATLSYFERNPAVLDALQKSEEAAGVAWKDMSDKQRALILQKANEVDTATIEAAANSAAGMLEGLKSILFDEYSGIFGFLKEFKFNGSETTIVKQFTNTLKSFIGKDSIFATIANMLSMSGLGENSALIFISQGLVKVKQFADNFNSFLKSFSGDFASLFKQGKFVEISTAFFNKIIKSIDGMSIGRKLAEIQNFLIDSFLTVITTIDWAALGGALLSVIGGYISSLDWGDLFKGAMVTLGAMAVPALLSAAGSALLALAGSIAAGIVAAVGLPVVLIGAAIAGVGALIIANWDSLKNLAMQVGAAAINIFNQVVNIVTSNWTQITSTVIQMFSTFLSPLGLIISLAKAFGVDINSVVNNMFNTIKSVIQGIANAIRSAASAISSIIPAPASQAKPSSSGPGTLVNRAGGQITDVMKKELSMAPSGAIPVIANSSELILNKAQQANLVNSINSRKSGISLSVGNIAIYGVQNPVEIADQVIAEIEARIQRMEAYGY